jgi:hypothetical protein
MTYGLRVINDDSELLIDSEYVNPTFVQKVEFNSIPVRQQAGSFYAHRYYTLREYRTPNISIPGTYIVLWTIPENFENNVHKDVWYTFPTSVSSANLSFACYVYSNALGAPLTYNLPTGYVFAVDSTAVSSMFSTGPALRMFNSAGGKTFDSNLIQLVPYTFSDSVSLPTSTGGDSDATLGSLPANPIFLLPNSDLLTLINRSVYFSNYSGHVETLSSTSFRRTGSTVYFRVNGVYSAQSDVSLPQDYNVFQNGSTNSLSIMVADANFYQTPAAPGGGGSNPTYTLSSNFSTVNEGTTFVITLSTTLVTNGTVFPYTVTGISAGDLSAGALNGNFVVQNNTATASFTVRNDSLLEGTEIFTLSLVGINSSVSVSILDTSKPAPIYSFGAISAVNEGTTGYVNFNYEYAAGKTVQFAIVAPTSGVAANSADVTLNFIAAAGLVINQSNDGAGSYSVGYDVAADTTTEGIEYFRVSATVDNTTYYSDNIPIIDTSVTPVSYSISAANNWTENTTTNTATITATGINGSTIYFTTNNGLVVPQTASATSNSNNYSITISYNVGLVTSTTSVTLQVRTGSPSGPVVATKIISVTNTPPSFSFGGVSAINEGSTGSVQFNFSNAAGLIIAFSLASPSSGEQNDGSSDVTLNTTSFTVGNTDAAGTISVSYSVGNDAITEGNEFFRVQAYVNGSFVASSDNILIFDTSRTRSYSISTASTWAEGTTTNAITINAYNANGIALYLTSSNSNIAYVTAPYATSWTVNNDSYSAITYFSAANVVSSTNVTLHLRTDSPTGTIVAQTTVTITDTPPQFSFGPTSPINEGSSGSVQFNFSDAAQTTLNFYVAGPPFGDQNDGSNDVILNTTSHTVNTDAAGSVTVSYFVPADGITEGNEYFTIHAYVNGVYFTSSDSILIFDTSRTPAYSLTINNAPWRENSVQSTAVTLTNVVGRTYYPTSNNSAVNCQTSSFYVSSNSFTTTLFWDIGEISADTTVTVFLRRDSPSGTIDAQASVLVRNILPAGTPIGGAFCLNNGVAPYTLRQVRADGNGGTYNDDTNNSPSCGYVPPTPRGTYLSQYCSGFNLYYRFADGNYGFYDVLQETNSATCGYVPPPVYAITSPLNIDESTTQGTATLLHYNIVGNKNVTISAISPPSGQQNDGSGDVIIVTPSFTVTGFGTPTIRYYANPDSVTEGTEYFRLQAVVDGSVVAISDTISISDTSRFLPSGTPIGGAFCLNNGVAPYTLRQVRADGNGGTYNDDTNNSPSCGYVPPTPRGTYLSQYCIGFSLYYRYADGNYGFYDELYQNNSPTCGWNPPAYGTYLSQYCSGFSLYYRYADGNYGFYDVLQANNSPSCGYVPPSYSLRGTFSSLNNGASASFYLEVTNPPAGDNIYVSLSGAGAARASVSPTYFVTNTSTTIYYITLTNTTPTSSIGAESVTVTVSYNNGATPLSFSYSIPEYNVAATAPIVTLLDGGGLVYAGQGINSLIYFSGVITADTYIQVRVGPAAAAFGDQYIYYPSISGAATSGTPGSYGDYVTWSLGNTNAYYAGPVNPGGFFPPINGVTISARAVTASGTPRQDWINSYNFTLDGGGGGGGGFDDR